MTCPGCGQTTRICVVCPAGAECPTPVCGECAGKALRWREAEQERVVAALEEKARVRDRLAFRWHRATYGIRARFGRNPEAPWILPGAPERDEAKPRHTTRIFNPPSQYEGDEERFDVECDLCGWLTAADDVDEAESIVLLHEEMEAVPVHKEVQS